MIRGRRNAGYADGRTRFGKDLMEELGREI